MPISSVDEEIFVFRKQLYDMSSTSSDQSELRVLRGVQHHHASLHELISLHSHMLIAQIDKLRSDVATLETELTESRLHQQKQLAVLREQQQLLESQNADIEGARAAKSAHATEIESVRNALQREVQGLVERLTASEVALEAETSAKRAAEAALISARNDAEKKLSDVRAQMGEHHNALLIQQRSLLSETFAKEAELKQTAAIALEREKFSEKMAETKSLLRSVVETLKKENEELTVQLEDAEKENDDLLSRLERAETVVRSVQQASLAASLAAEAKTLAERDARDKLDREVRDRAIAEREYRTTREQQQQQQKQQREKEQKEEKERQARETALEQEKERLEREEKVKMALEVERAAAAEEEKEAREAAFITSDEVRRKKKATEEEEDEKKALAAAKSNDNKNEVAQRAIAFSSSSSSSIQPNTVELPAAVVSSPQRSFGVKVGVGASSPFGALSGAPKRSTPSFLSSVAASKLHEQALKASSTADSSATSIVSTEVPSLSSSTVASAAEGNIPIEERARREAERLRSRSIFGGGGGGGGIKKESANNPPAAAQPSVPKWKASLISSTAPSVAPAPAPATTIAPVPAPIIASAGAAAATPSSSSSRALDMLAGVSVTTSSESAPLPSSSSSSITETAVPESVEIDDAYSSMSKEDLKALLVERGLASNGKMKEMRARLREDDAIKETKEKEERKAKKKLDKAAAAAAALATMSSTAIVEGSTPVAPTTVAAAVLPMRKPPPAPPQ